MKKLITVAAVTMLLGATVGWAQIIVTTTVHNVAVLTGPIAVDVKVKLSDNTSPSVTGVKYAEVAEITSGKTGDSFSVLGTAITDTTNHTVNATNVVSTINLSSNVFLAGDTPVDLGKGKFVEALFGDGAGPFGLSNSVWLVFGTAKLSSKGTNVSAKVEGIWKEGDTAFKGSIKNSKTQ